MGNAVGECTERPNAVSRFKLKFLAVTHWRFGLERNHHLKLFICGTYLLDAPRLHTGHSSSSVCAKDKRELQYKGQQTAKIQFGFTICFSKFFPCHKMPSLSVTSQELIMIILIAVAGGSELNTISHLSSCWWHLKYICTSSSDMTATHPSCLLSLVWGRLNQDLYFFWLVKIGAFP